MYYFYYYKVNLYLNYFDYLDYKLEHSAAENEVNAKLLKDAATFFESLEAKVDSTLSKVTERSEEQIANIQQEAVSVLNKIDLFNKDLSTNLENFKKLNTSLENFVLEDEDIETPKAELVGEDEVNKKEEKTIAE